jgi:glycosyltransferase involved in cell wall biosynthesis
MTNQLPFVSIIIPCKNEEKFIAKCLDSILIQDFAKENLEVLVIDGASEDKTKEIVRSYARKYPFIKLLENAQKYTPFGLNIGVKAAQGDIIMRMDAHAGYENDYIAKCVKYSQESGADNVGGRIRTVPADQTSEAKAVAICLSHPFGVASSFRLGSANPREVDTVFGGCYKKEVFKKIGYFNEKLLRSQDYEFNLRLRAAGGKIIMFPDILATYYPQATLWGFLKHNFEDGFWVTYPLKFKIKYFGFRHLLPLIFVLTIILLGLLSLIFPIFRLLFELLIIFYLFLTILFSWQIALKNKNFGLTTDMLIAFLSRHFGYGLGSLWGLVKILIK